jgi:hypothetical protein
VNLSESIVKVLVEGEAEDFMQGFNANPGSTIGPSDEGFDLSDEELDKLGTPESDYEFSTGEPIWRKSVIKTVEDVRAGLEFRIEPVRRNLLLLVHVEYTDEMSGEDMFAVLPGAKVKNDPHSRANAMGALNALISRAGKWVTKAATDQWGSDRFALAYFSREYSPTFKRFRLRHGSALDIKMIDMTSGEEVSSEI